MKGMPKIDFFFNQKILPWLVCLILSDSEVLGCTQRMPEKSQTLQSPECSSPLLMHVHVLHTVLPTALPSLSFHPLNHWVPVVCRATLVVIQNIP